MQVCFKPQITQNFKGSFKIQDLDAYVEDFEETPADFRARKKRYKQEYLQTQKEKDANTSLVVKKTGYIDPKSGYVTAVVMHPSIQGGCKKSLQPTYLDLCKKHDVDPDHDLFMVSGLDSLQRRYVMFNSFYKDSATGQDYVQLFYTSSEYDELMPIQKDIIKIFNDVRNKKYLCQGSTANPLAKASENGVMLGAIFQPAISGLECISCNMPDDEIFNSQGNINPVIYTQKPYGDYIRYKVVTLYK